jgi:hypothetical protein
LPASQGRQAGLAHQLLAQFSVGQGSPANTLSKLASRSNENSETSSQPHGTVLLHHMHGATASSAGVGSRPDHALLAEGQGCQWDWRQGRITLSSAAAAAYEQKYEQQ